MKINNRKVDAVLPLVIALSLIIGILIGFGFKNTQLSTGPSPRGLLFFPSNNKINQVFDLVTSSYVDSVSTNKLEEDAIAGMLKNLDPYSQYIPASELAAVNEPIEGNFSGIGVSFNMMNDTVVVINTVPKGPSEKVGIMPGDRIIFVEDSLVAGQKIPSNGIVKMLKGKTGTKVKVSILRKGTDELLVFEITRDKIPLFSIDVAYMVTPGTGYIKVGKFSKTTLQDFSEAMKSLKEQGMEKLIIDLRGNLGGILDAATGIADFFLPEGKLIVYTEGYNRKRQDYYSKSRNNKYYDMELVLLIDEASASASEILTGAIQDNDRGTIVGRRSFGKGLVQEAHNLQDGSAIRLTVSRYYTPTGRSIQKPYQEDREGYYNELNERFIHGEMLQADSMYFNDTLKYITPGGKVVYGGGGIIPDAFVPIDTTAYSKYYDQVIRRGLLYRFAFDYSDKHRKELSTCADYQSLYSFLQQKNILKLFNRYVTEQGIHGNKKDLQRSSEIIENYLIAFIARNILDDKGYYPVLNMRDPVVQKSIEILSTTKDDQ